ncbi:MAG: hypothetical protein IJE48_07070 [Clostridia bacterium]|nr:hypothetical protein [Clostridia bacterium]
MAAILLKVFSAVMSVVVTLSGTFPALFGNRVYIDPAENTELLDGVKELTVITDFETADSVLNINESVKFDEEFFRSNNLVCIPVTLPSTSYKAFVSSIAEKGDTAEINYSLVNDGCVGLTVICRETICVAVSKNIKNAEVSETKIFVPFCIHED